jgi:hypothetical protein
MSRFLSLVTASLRLGLLALAVFVFDLACLPHNPPSQKNALQTWAEILARTEQVDQLEEELDRYWEAKRHVAKEVIAGRRSLAEAIDAFRKLEQPWIPARQQEQTLKVLRMSEVEWRGRKVIYIARRVLADRPDEAAAVADRLEKELQKLLADPRKTCFAPTDPRAEERKR